VSQLNGDPLLAVNTAARLREPCADVAHRTRTRGRALRDPGRAGRGAGPIDDRLGGDKNGEDAVMKFGLNITYIRADELIPASRLAEELGFASLVMGEHIAVPVELRTPYRGKVGINAMSYRHEPYVALAHVAAVTSKVRLGTGVSILPIHEPLQLARAITTLDVLSNGRLDLAIGAGSIEEEFEVMGFDYASRGPRMDEMVEIFNRLWTQEEIAFSGEHYNFRAIGFEPKPVQKPRPPLYVGSQAKAGLKRAARIGDGWYGSVYDPAAARAIMETIQGHMKEYGRDPASFKYSLIHASGEPILPTAEQIRDYEALGVEMITVSPIGRDGVDVLPKIREIARTLGLKPA
jgi:probable F420-dependent oxidoreductase